MDDYTLREYNAQLELCRANNISLQKWLSKAFNQYYANIEGHLSVRLALWFEKKSVYSA